MAKQHCQNTEEAAVQRQSTEGLNLNLPTSEPQITSSEIHLTGSELHIIDMSVPRNVDPQVAEIGGIRLHNFDDLSAIVKQNMAEREALAEEADVIIFAALAAFERWQHTLLAAPVIAQLRGKVENIRQSYLHRRSSVKRSEKSPGKSPGNKQLGQQQLDKVSREHLDKVSRLLINQILHQPTTRLKATLDQQSLQKQVEVLRLLFDLDPLTVPPSQKRGHLDANHKVGHIQDNHGHGHRADDHLVEHVHDNHEHGHAQGDRVVGHVHDNHAHGHAQGDRMVGHVHDSHGHGHRADDHLVEHVYDSHEHGHTTDHHKIGRAQDVHEVGRVQDIHEHDYVQAIKHES